jgi:hypothetical protein
MGQQRVVPELLTLPEFATTARTTIETVRYWRRIGYGPKGFRLGRQVLFMAAEVRDFIEDARRSVDGMA